MNNISFFVSLPAEYHMSFYRALVESGVNVKVYYYAKGDKPFCPGVEFIPVDIARNYTYNSRRFDSSVSVTQSFKIFRASKNIVIHGWSSPYWLFLIFFAVISGKNIYFLNDLNSRALDQDVKGKVKKVLKKLFLKTIYTFASGAVCTSDENVKFTSSIKKGIDLYRMSWHALYISDFIRSIGNSEGRSPVQESSKYSLRSIYIGRYEVHKGLDRLVEYYVKNCSEQLNLYGYGSFLLPDVPNMIDYGPYSPEDLFDIIKPGDLCIFPSDYEPLGLAILEAASLGALLVVSEKVVAAKEVFNKDCESVKFFTCQTDMEEHLSNLLRLSSNERVKLGLSNKKTLENWISKSSQVTTSEIYRFISHA